jgi:hypothetical protein
MNYDVMMKAEGNKEMKRQEEQAAEAGRNEVAGSLAAQRALGRMPAKMPDRQPKRRMTR